MFYHGSVFHWLPMFVIACSLLSVLACAVHFLLATCFFDAKTLSLVRYADPMITPSYFKDVLVHLDFKGAPPSLVYLREIIPILAYSGATSLVLEWEDMLPYQDKFDNLHPYSETDVFHILAIAEASNLSVIPFVPLYSDMDFVLKVKDFATMRQNFNSTRYLCPNATSSLDTVFKMIGRVMDFHRDAKYFHIGFRGPFSLECSKDCCHGRPIYDVIINHLVAIVRHFHTMYPRVKILMWDDLFRCVPTSKIKQLMGLGKFVIPVLQPFDETAMFGTNLDTYMEFLAAIFPQVWISGNYRGVPASQDFKLIPNLNQQLGLNSRQVDVVETFQHKFDFPITSFLLSGSQRDTHFSLLNEVLPACLPSICLSCYSLRHRVVGYKGVGPLFRELRCPPIHPMDEAAYDRCRYPGHEVYKIMVDLQTLVRSDEYEQLQEWKRSRYMRYNLQHRYLPTAEVSNGLAVLSKLWEQLQRIISEVKTKLRDKFYRATDAEEWLEQNILPLLLDLKAMRQSFSTMKKFWHWPRRDFNTSDELIREFGTKT